MAKVVHPVLCAAAVLFLGAGAFAALPSAIAPPGARPAQRLDWYGDPGAPNLSGVWVLEEQPARAGASREGWTPWSPPLKGEFAAKWKKRVADAAAGKRTDDPVRGCLPPGMPRYLTGAKNPLLLMQTPRRVTLYRDGETPRRIWLDGRAFPAPEDLEVFPHGTSVGRYEGDEMVIETIGLTDMPIDATGVPHSDQLKIVSRLRRVDERTLRVQVTLTDPVAFSKSMATTATYRKLDDPSWEPREYLCTPVTDHHPEIYVR